MLAAFFVAGCGRASVTSSPSILAATARATAPATIATAPSPTPPPTAVPTPTPQPADDWPVYHLDPQRTGNAAGFPAPTGAATKAWSAQLDGAVYAEPLVVHGQVIAATEGDSVYALDPQTGATLWHQNLGTPVRRAALPCGDIDPLGITGTPAYDPKTNSIFAVAEVAGPKHVLFALDPSSGAVLWSRNVDVAGEDPTTHQQRPALAVANGYVYIGFGGLAGDCGQYTGKVVGVPVTGQGDTILYRVPVAREGAIWATGGPVVDASGNLYVSVGNGSSTTKFDGSDSVLELSPSLQLLSSFAPATWAADNAGDADLGSLSPTLMPGGLVFIAGKSGSGYVLRAGSLGGIGGQLSTARLCAPFGGSATTGDTVFVPCTSGLMAVRVGTDASIKVAWQSSSGATGSPVVGGGAVWSLDIGSGRLIALDSATGAIWESIATGQLPHFASPTLWRGMAFVGTRDGIFAARV